MPLPSHTVLRHCVPATLQEVTCHQRTIPHRPLFALRPSSWPLSGRVRFFMPMMLKPPIVHRDRPHGRRHLLGSGTVFHRGSGASNALQHTSPDHRRLAFSMTGMQHPGTPSNIPPYRCPCTLLPAPYYLAPVITHPTCPYPPGTRPPYCSSVAALTLLSTRHPTSPPVLGGSGLPSISARPPSQSSPASSFARSFR